MKLSRLTGIIIIAGIVLVVVIFLVVKNFTMQPQVASTSTATSAAALAKTDLPVAPVFDRTATSTRAAPQSLVVPEGGQRPTQTPSPVTTQAVATTSLPSPTGLPSSTNPPTATVTQQFIATLPQVVTLAPSAQTTPTQGRPASFGFTLLYLTSSAHAGAAAQATIKTAPGTICSISVILPKGAGSSAPGLSPVTAGVDGVCSWFWGVPANSALGSGYVTISANGQTQTFVLFIQ